MNIRTKSDVFHTETLFPQKYIRNIEETALEWHNWTDLVLLSRQMTLMYTYLCLVLTVLHPCPSITEVLQQAFIVVRTIDRLVVR